MDGWIKIYRKVLDNPIVCKDADYFSVWMYLLLSATHKNYDALFNGKRITLKPGQFLTGRKSIASKFNISESKTDRILKCFESEHQIEQQTSNKNRLISIVEWELYQQSEQQSEQQLNNKRTTTEQQVNTNKNVKNVKNDNNEKKKEICHFVPPTLDEVKEYCTTRNNRVDADRFIDFYSSKGWMIGKNKMKDWKAAVRTWEKRDKIQATEYDNEREPDPF